MSLSLEGWLGGLSEGVRGSVCLQAGFQNLPALDDGPGGPMARVWGQMSGQGWFCPRLVPEQGG